MGIVAEPQHWAFAWAELVCRVILQATEQKINAVAQQKIEQLGLMTADIFEFGFNRKRGHFGSCA